MDFAIRAMKPGAYSTHLESCHTRSHRWGDGRDELPAAVRQTQQHTIEGAGGSTPHPLEDHGFMLSWGFEDLDGHNWGLAWMRD